MADRIRIFVNNSGTLKAFAINPEDLLSIRVCATQVEYEQAIVAFDIIEDKIRRAEAQAELFPYFEVFGRLTEKKDGLL